MPVYARFINAQKLSTRFVVLEGQDELNSVIVGYMLSHSMILSGVL